MRVSFRDKKIAIPGCIFLIRWSFMAALIDNIALCDILLQYCSLFSGNNGNNSAPYVSVVLGRSSGLVKGRIVSKGLRIRGV